MYYVFVIAEWTANYISVGGKVHKKYDDYIWYNYTATTFEKLNYNDITLIWVIKLLAVYIPFTEKIFILK